MLDYDGDEFIASTSITPMSTHLKGAGYSTTIGAGWIDRSRGAYGLITLDLDMHASSERNLKPGKYPLVIKGGDEKNAPYATFSLWEQKLIPSLPENLSAHSGELIVEHFKFEGNKVDQFVYTFRGEFAEAPEPNIYDDYDDTPKAADEPVGELYRLSGRLQYNRD